MLVIAASSLRHSLEKWKTGTGTFRHQQFGRQYGVGHMGDKSVDQMG